MNDYTIAFLIGNGFDLDLGLKTSYMDFLNSKHFPKDETSSYFIQNIINASRNNWIDLELELKRYADNDYTGNGFRDDIDYFEEVYNKMQYGLYEYIASCEKRNLINDKCCAFQLINKIAEIQNSKIITFNYTNVKAKEGICFDKEVVHAHGSISNKDIILGIQDNVDIEEDYHHLIKSHNDAYRSCNIREVLRTSDEVILFGLSLGETDYHYFEDFFLEQSGLSGKDVKKKVIRIYTYDENSRQAILRNLRTMNEKRVNYLYDLNDLLFIRTKFSEYPLDRQLFNKELQRYIEIAEQEKPIDLGSGFM